MARLIKWPEVGLMVGSRPNEDIVLCLYRGSDSWA